MIKVKSENQPPGDPIILGPLSGKVETLYDYNFTSIDPDGDDVSYYIDWDDGTPPTWTAFQLSGIPYTESHTWSIQETYTIKAKAKDVFGAESDLATLEVTMPRNRAIQIPFLNFLQNFMANHLNLFPILQRLPEL